MPTDVNVATITVGISVPTPGVPANVYAETIVVTAIVGGAYIPPTPVPPPVSANLKPVLQSVDVMPTPTIVNGRPT